MKCERNVIFLTEIDLASIQNPVKSTFSGEFLHHAAHLSQLILLLSFLINIEETRSKILL
jgi:hypothetical protein